MIEHIEPKATADGVAVYCAHDKIVDTDSLVGNPRNPNKHPKEQITALAKIIKRQGWRHPIVVSNRSGFVVKVTEDFLPQKKSEQSKFPLIFRIMKVKLRNMLTLWQIIKYRSFQNLI